MKKKKKTTKKKNKTKKLKKPKVNKNKLTVKDVLDLMNKEDYKTAMSKLLEYADLEIRVRFVVDYLNRSRFRAYGTAMRRFVAAIHTYLTSKNIKVLNSYWDQYLNTFSSEISYNLFIDIRRCIIKDIKEKEFTFTYNSILKILNKEAEIEGKDLDKKVKEFVAEFSSVVFKDASGLKILFGGNNDARKFKKTN